MKKLAIVFAAIVLAGCGSSSIKGSGTVAPPSIDTPSETPSVDYTIPPDVPIETPTPEPTPSENLFGQPVGSVITVSGANDDSKVLVTVFSITVSTLPQDSLGQSPDNGEYVVADVGYTCQSGPCSYNELEWSAVDPQGRSYDGSFGGKEPSLGSSNDLATGRNVRGFVTLDAAPGVSEVAYSPLGAGGSASWKIP